MQPWQRRRHPLDVPTPVAVALSDFCRRAKAPGSAAQIRDALSLLEESDDFRVRELTDGEVTVTPLGPFALVDMVMGASPELASQRELTGYYELARSLVVDAALPERDQAVAEPSKPKQEPLFSDVAREKKASRAQVKAAATLASRIGPRKRPVSQTSAPIEVPDSGYRKRDLPKGRGRFTVVTSSPRSIAELTRPTAKEELELLIDQSGNRVALKRRLASGFASKRGKPLTLADVEEAVDEQQLTAMMQKREREAILSALTQSRGALTRAAQSLAMSEGELGTLTKTLGLTREAGEIRERFSREALSSRFLSSRLTLVHRAPYLKDLGIEKKFKDALSRDVCELLDRSLDHQVSLEALIDAVARREGLKADQLEAAIAQLGLSARYRERLSG